MDLSISDFILARHADRRKSFSRRYSTTAGREPSSSLIAGSRELSSSLAMRREDMADDSRAATETARSESSDAGRAIVNYRPLSLGDTSSVNSSHSHNDSHNTSYNNSYNNSYSSTGVSAAWAAFSSSAEKQPPSQRGGNEPSLLPSSRTVHGMPHASTYVASGAIPLPMSPSVLQRHGHKGHGSSSTSAAASASSPPIYHMMPSAAFPSGFTATAAEALRSSSSDKNKDKDKEKEGGTAFTVHAGSPTAQVFKRLSPSTKVFSFSEVKRSPDSGKVHPPPPPPHFDSRTKAADSPETATEAGTETAGTDADAEAEAGTRAGTVGTTLSGGVSSLFAGLTDPMDSLQAVCSERSFDSSSSSKRGRHSPRSSLLGVFDPPPLPLPTTARARHDTDINSDDRATAAAAAAAGAGASAGSVSVQAFAASRPRISINTAVGLDDSTHVPVVDAAGPAVEAEHHTPLPPALRAVKTKISNMLFDLSSQV
jgi:hypothetical protein